MSDDYDDDGTDAVTSEDFEGFEMVPTALHLGGGVSSHAVHAWLALRRYATMREQRAVPTRERIAADIGKAPRTADGYLNELVQTGFLLITPRARTTGGQTTNLYEVLVRPILTADDPRLVRHLQRVARYEAEHGRLARRATWDSAAAAERHARYTARLAPVPDAAIDKTAGQVGVAGSCYPPPPPSRILLPPLAGSCYPPSQDPATHESDSLELEEVELEEDPLSAHADDEGDPVGQLMILTVAAPTPPSFEDFWSVYPRQVKRVPAKARWDQLVKAGADPAAIVAGAAAYAEWCRARCKAQEYIAHPQQWLKDGRWNDRLDPAPAGLPAGAKPAPSDLRLAEGMETRRLMAELEAADPTPDPVLARLNARAQTRRIAYRPLEDAR